MPNAIADAEPKHQLVASLRHSLVFLAIVAGVIVAGFSAQNRQVAGGGLVESHVHVIPIYLSVTVMNWLLALYVWKGIRVRGGSAAALIGGRWGNVRELFRDLGIATLFWGAFVATGWGVHRLMGVAVHRELPQLFVVGSPSRQPFERLDDATRPTSRVV